MAVKLTIRDPYADGGKTERTFDNATGWVVAGNGFITLTDKNNVLIAEYAVQDIVSIEYA